MGSGSRRVLAGLVAATLVAMPALAGAASDLAGPISTPVPEPSDFVLFVIGVVGLVIGRRTARSRGRPDDRDA